MMPLAFASSMGGILTLIGTPPNLIVDGYLRDNGREGFAFFDFLPIGIICCAVGFALLYPLCRFMLGKRRVREPTAAPTIRWPTCCTSITLPTSCSGSRLKAAACTLRA